MTIKKFQGNTKEEAIEKAKAELGDSVVIMNVKEVRSSGVLGIFKKATYEVTAALEENRSLDRSNLQTEGNHFDAVAGERGFVRKSLDTNLDANTGILSSISNEKKSNPVEVDYSTPKEEVDSLSLKSAFRAVNEVIQNGEMPVEKVKDSNRKLNPSPIYRKSELTEQSIEPPTQFENRVEIVNEENQKSSRDNRHFVKMLYNVLLENEVEEHYVNQILKDMVRVIQNGNNLDYLLSNVYQKMILMLGKPKEIQIEGTKPKVIMFIGPTGVGKTTTIAKLASRFKLVEGKNIALLTTDTYRIAATEQLQTYANILEVPCEVVMEGDNINSFIGKHGDKDLILIDTSGFSHKNAEQKDNMEVIRKSISADCNLDVYLVLSATTKFRDLKNIIDTYKQFTDFNLLFTKLDETDTYGNILNCKMYSGAELSYISTGQNVPDDISVIDIQHMVKKLLGGH